MRKTQEKKQVIAPLIDKLVKDEKTRKLFSRNMEMKKNIYLYDHNNSNAPVLFTASLLETMAEAASTMAPQELTLHEISDFHINETVNKIIDDSSEILIDVFSDPEIMGIFHCRILSDKIGSTDHNCSNRTLYSQGTFSYKKPEKDLIIKTDIPEFRGVKINKTSYSVAFHPLKFIMDGPLNNINKILTYDEDILVISVTNNLSDELHINETENNFITYPSMIESMFQSACILETLSSRRKTVPKEFNNAKFHKKLLNNEEYICIVNKKYTSSNPTYDISVVDME